MATKLVKTTTEFEGRYSEVWVLVDDADHELEAWPEPGDAFAVDAAQPSSLAKQGLVVSG